MGDVQAQFTIGRFAAEGIGMPPSPSEAARWFRQAARQGRPVAAYNFASFLGNSAKLAATMAEAERWYQFAAENGVQEARVKLAHLHLSGAIRAPDVGRAVNLLREASEAGDRNAKTQLALIYLSGSHGLHDSVQAEGLLLDAAEAGNPDASLHLGHLYSGQIDPAPLVRPGDAAKFYQIAAEAGSAVAQHQLAALLSGENASPACLPEAANWSRRRRSSRWGSCCAPAGASRRTSR